MHEQTRHNALFFNVDKQASKSNGEILLSIVKSDIKCSSSVITIVAPTGSDKTATVIGLAVKQFVIHISLSLWNSTLSNLHRM
jgi:hypothetical protein